MSAMYEMLKNNRQNSQLVAKIGIKLGSKFDYKAMIKILEANGSQESLLEYLAAVVPNTEDSEIFFKYI